MKNKISRALTIILLVSIVLIPVSSSNCKIDSLTNEELIMPIDDFNDDIYVNI